MQSMSFTKMCSISMPMFSSNWESRPATGWVMFTARLRCCQRISSKPSRQMLMRSTLSVHPWLWSIPIRGSRIYMCRVTSSLTRRCLLQSVRQEKCGGPTASYMISRRSFRIAVTQVSIRQPLTSANSMVLSMSPRWEVLPMSA